MLGFPEAVKAHILAELAQQCSAWSWAESLITNKIAWSLCHQPSTSWPGPVDPMKASAKEDVCWGLGVGRTLFPALKDFCQEILDRRRMFIISDILKCRKLAGISFPVPSAFNSSTLTPSTAKILSYPMRSSLNDSNDLLTWTFPLCT